MIFVLEIRRIKVLMNKTTVKVQYMDDILGLDAFYSEMFSKQTSNVGRASNMMTQIIKKFSIVRR